MLNQDYITEINGEVVLVPRGTKTSHKTASGNDASYNFVDEFGWLPKEQEHLLFDIIYRGLNVPAEFVEPENNL